jgi:hypothetical protein
MAVPTAFSSLLLASGVFFFYNTHVQELRGNALRSRSIGQRRWRLKAQLSF